MSEQLITIAVGAAELGVSQQCVHRWIVAKGKIPTVLFGKTHVMKRDDFDKFAADYRAGKYERWPR